jgi:anti-sigma regulatory factor (Ser/Thr protein kinase)
VTVFMTDPADPRPSITVRLHGGTGAPLRARRSVLPQLEGQLTETAVADVALIVSELVTNSVMHAHVGPDQTLTVECAPLADRLRITVTDPGARLEPHLRRPGPDVSGGYGLAIVSSLSLAWGVVRNRVGTTSVWCDLPRSTPRRRGYRLIESTELCGSAEPECRRHRTGPESERRHNDIP